MIRYLFPIFLIVGVLWWVKTLGRKAPGASSGQGRSQEARPPALPMVVCAQCGTHLPEPDALSRQGRWYCCVQHRDQQS